MNSMNIRLKGILPSTSELYDKERLLNSTFVRNHHVIC